MKRIDPYYYSKKYLRIFFYLSIAFIVYFFLSKVFELPIESSLIGVAISSPIFYQLQRSEYKKCFFELNPQQMRWKLMQNEHPKIINFETADPIFELNWMGLEIHDGNKKHAISLDGVKLKDRKRILKKLQAFYQAEGSLALC